MWLYMAMVHIESGFRNNIVNRFNCRGMFQVHAPSWARKLGLSYEDLLDPHKNADAGIRVFKYYLNLYRSKGPALSAYNSDHPHAARAYVRAVLGTRQRIRKRYTELYKALRDQESRQNSSLPPSVLGPSPPAKDPS
jgi:soluble lytic murein transglycosylase-like protein